MTDLLALQPNIDIKLHIVAPSNRRAKFMAEVKRPSFSLLTRKPLRQMSSFLDYEAVEEIAGERMLSHMRDSEIENYEEIAEDE
jgi:hypothetical protein